MYKYKSIVNHALMELIEWNSIKGGGGGMLVSGFLFKYLISVKLSLF